MVRGITVALAAPLLLGGQEFLRNPLHFWPQQSEYAGSEACKECHSAIDRLQAASHHALSLRRAADTSQFASGAPVEQTDPISGSTLLISKDHGPRITAIKGSDQSSLALEWAFGSGVKGITPVGRQTGGEFIEGRLSWYASLSGFDF